MQTLNAFPGRVFDGEITTIGANVDPNTRRVLVRSEIKDPQHELRAGTFANFVIASAPPVRSPGIPRDGVVLLRRRHHDRLGHRRSPQI